jgi:hypothetical protein
MMEPHPEAPVPILCGGESEAAMRRAARLCDGWLGTGYTWEEAVERVAALQRYRLEYGRHHEPFEIILALREPPTVELFRRAEGIGITGAMCLPWAGIDEVHEGDHRELQHPAERYRAPIQRFAEQVIDAFR